MNDHDIGLIVDLIESRLSASEAETALARIMADPDLSAAYAEQLSVRTSLDAVPVASMTAEEKLALNDALVTQLRLEDGPVVVPIARERKAWWAPVVGITAAAAAVTAIFVIPGMSGSDHAASDTTIVASASAEAPTEQDRAIEPAGAEGDDGTAAAEEFGSVAEELEAAEAPVSVKELKGADLVDVLDATAGESSPEAVEDRLNALGYTDSASVSSDTLARCISDISTQLPPNTTDVVLFGVDTSGPTHIAHLGLIFDDGIAAAMSVNLDTCAIVDLGN